MFGAATCETDELQWACEETCHQGDLRVDVAPFLGIRNRKMFVPAKDLLDVIKYHDDPQVGISWDDKRITIGRIDGGMIAAIYFV